MLKVTLFLLFTVFCLVSGCGPERRTHGDHSYFAEVIKFRTDKNNYFKNGEDSPLPEEVKKDFDSLLYYPINKEFRIIADFVSIPGQSIISIPLNNGESRSYIRHGFATFTIDESPNSLLVFKSIDGSSNELFVPFYDKTSGFTTYGGGRYLEPLQISEDKILLDFNYSYNPFCVYSSEFVCPLPPLDNTLQIPIEAGEKNFENP